MVLTLVFTALPAGKAWGQGFFDPAPDLTGTLDPDNIYPQGQVMAFGFYSIIGQNNFEPGKTNMQRVAEAGFTMAGPYYRDSEAQFLANVGDAAALGLKYTYQIRRPFSLDGVSVADRPAAIALMSDQDITDWVTSQVNIALNNPAANASVARWSLEPEELRYWKPDELRYLQLASQAIAAAEAAAGQAHRPFWMYEPNNRTSSQLQITAPHQDLTGRGVYVTTRFDRSDVRSGWMMQAIDYITDAAAQSGNTPQVFYQLSEDFTDPLTGTDPVEIRRVIRHDVYLGLVRGAKSLNIWSHYENRPNLTTHEEQFTAYGSVANDLTGELGLQDIFLFGDKRSDLIVTQLTGQQTLTLDPGTTYDAISTFEAAYEDDRYLIMVNSAETAATARISGLPRVGGYFIHDLFADTVFYTDLDQVVVDFDVLGVRALKFTARHLHGDLNSDGRVDDLDLQLVLGNWGQSVTPDDWRAGDPTGDGQVGADDLDVVLTHFGDSVPILGASVPEPGTLALLGLGLSAGIRRERHPSAF